MTELIQVDSLFFNTMPFDVIQKIREEQDSKDVEKIIESYSKAIVLNPLKHVISNDTPRLNFSISFLKQKVI